MGNSTSQHVFLEKQPDWEAYTQAEWRSERARELDKFGSIARHPVPRGESMTAKLMFLQRQIKEQRNEISANVESKRDKDMITLEQGGPRKEILQKKFGGGLLHSMSLSRAPSSRHRNLDIPGMGNESSVPVLRKPGLETYVAEPVHNGLVGDGVSNYGFHGVEKVHVPVHKTVLLPAEWRTRVHAARRRVLLIILVYVRWSSVLRRKRRMPRVDSFSYYIPAVFDEDLKRFLAEHKKYARLLAEGGGGGKGLKFKEADPVVSVVSHVSDEESEDEGSVKPMVAKGALRTSKTMTRVGGNSLKVLAPSPSARKPGLARGSLSSLLEENINHGESSGGAEGDRPSPNSDRNSPAASSSRPQNLMHFPTFSGPAGRTSYAGNATDFTSTATAPFSTSNQEGLIQGSPQTSKYGFKPAYLRSLAPKAVERAVKSNWQGRASESGAIQGQSSNAALPDAVVCDAPESPRSSIIPGSTDWRTTPCTSFNTAVTDGINTSNSSRIDSRQVSNASSILTFPSINARETASASSGVSPTGILNRGSNLLSPLSKPEYAYADLPPTPSRLGSPPQVESDSGLRLPRVGRHSMGGNDLSRYNRPFTPTLPSMEKESSSEGGWRTSHTPHTSHREPSTSETGAEANYLTSSLTPAKLVKELRASISGAGAVKEEEEPDKFAEEMAEAMERAAGLTIENSEPVARTPLEDSSRLLSMYVNRGNASWASNKNWAAPRIWSKASQDEWKVSIESQIWRSHLISSLKAGQIAIQILAYQDPMLLPDGSLADPWTMDPWEVIVSQNPKVPRVCIKGVPLGIRTLMNLALSIEGMAGKDAASKLTVVLHVSESQLDKVLDQILAFNFCGLDPGNILLITQGKRKAYKYHSLNKKFSSVPSSQPQFVGSGLSMMQLNWASEARRMDATGEATTIIETVLEDLEAKNVNWLLSYNSCDLSLLTRESFIDLICLPFTMSLHKTGSANCSIQAMKSESLAFLGKLAPAHPAAVGSVLLGQRGKEALGAALQPVAELGASELQAGNMKENLRLAKSAGGRDYCVGVGRYAMHLSLLKNLLVSTSVFRPKLILQKDLLYVHMDAGDLLAAEGARAVCLQTKGDVKQLLSHEDLSDLIPLLEAQDALSAFKRIATQRNITQSSSLNDSSKPGRQPVSGEPSLSRISDEGRTSTSYSRKLRAVAQDGLNEELSRSVKGAARVSNDHAAVDKSDNMLQDDLPVENTQTRRGVSSALVCVVFVTGSSISHAAVDAAIQMVKSGRDTIHLVTVISSGGVQAGQSVLNQYLPQVTRAMVNYEAQVLSATMETLQHGLLDMMEEYIQKVGAGMVVMGSKALSSQMLQSSAVLGSVTLAAVKRIRCPILVINSNSAANITSCKDGAMRAMVVAQRNSSINELVAFLCNVLQPKRGDSLLLGQVQIASSVNSSAGFDAVRAQRVMAETRQVNGLAQTAVLKGFPPQPTVHLENETLPDILDALKRESVHLLGYLLPQTIAHVPEILVHLLHTSKSAVLIYRNQLQGESSSYRR